MNALPFDTLSFTILANGKPLVVTNDKSIKKNIQDWINKNGIKWIPAKMKLRDVLFSYEPNDTNALIDVNSKFDIHFNSN